MTKYQKGKIYKLTNEENDLVYYGSTTRKLKTRFLEHKRKYKVYLKEKEQYYFSFEIIKYSSAKIELVEEFPCDTKKELHEREGFYIRNNECVNKVIPDRTQKEYYKQNKKKIREKIKNYQQKNKQKIKKPHKNPKKKKYQN